MCDEIPLMLGDDLGDDAGDGVEDICKRPRPRRYRVCVVCWELKKQEDEQGRDKIANATLRVKPQRERNFGEWQHHGRREKLPASTWCHRQVDEKMAF